MAPGDWEAVRAMRLAALADAPSSFESTLERELELDESAWRGRLVRAITLQAWSDDRALGMLTVVQDDEGSDTAQVTGLWVEPASRGRGVAAALMDEAARCWAGAGGRRLRLWVVGANAAAQRLYAAQGFAPTGRSGEFRGLPEIELSRAV
ncbi:MAG TPA: GNAT family N-acetyltransferase [Actinomycetales bacterium]|jgi:ribosomal protein S18 acetylase RimI-like enzyme